MSPTDVSLRPDPFAGFYGPGSQMWRINREAVLLGAGPAALLLQIAHPLVAEGVAAHSRFEDDPFARLRRTLRTTLDMVFGDGAAAARAVERLNGVHARVEGEVLDPAAISATGSARYRALDPELLLWVQTTLLVMSVRAYEAWVGCITAAEREVFWGEARRVGVLLGIPAQVSPGSWTELEDWFEGQLGPAGPIRVTPTARRLSTGIIRPPLPLVPRPLVDLVATPGLALLPPRLRHEFGIDWSVARQSLGQALGLGLRAWVRIVPPGWRAMPPARAAERRMASPANRARAAQARRQLPGRQSPAITAEDGPPAG